METYGLHNLFKIIKMQLNIWMPSLVGFYYTFSLDLNSNPELYHAL